MYLGFGPRVWLFYGTWPIRSLITTNPGSKAQTYKKRVRVRVRVRVRLFPTVHFIGKYIFVLDRVAFRLELDYRSVTHILVKVLSNQDSAMRMALKPVRV